MDIPCTLFIHRQTFGLSLGAYDRQCSISTHINFHVDIYVYVYIKIYLLCVCVHMHQKYMYVHHRYAVLKEARRGR